MAKKSDFVSALDRIKALPKERRERIEAAAAKILEEMHLGEIRKALKVPQTALAMRSGMKQAEISRIENNPATVQLRTIERYAHGLGAEVHVTLAFPDGTEARIPVNRAGKLSGARMVVETTLRAAAAAATVSKGSRDR